MTGPTASGFAPAPGTPSGDRQRGWSENPSAVGSFLVRSKAAVSTSCADDRAKLCSVSVSSANPPPPPANERALVERAGKDADAFAELYRHYVPRVHAYAWRRTGSREAAEDITAATFEAALRALPRFRWGRGGFAPWLFRIASNQIIGYHRREARPKSDRGQRAMATMTESTTLDTFVELDGRSAGGLGGTDAELVRRAITQLGPRYQRAIGLRYLAELDHEAAARAMSLAKPAFAVVLSRALKALRREFDRLDLDFDGDLELDREPPAGRAGGRQPAHPATQDGLTS